MQNITQNPHTSVAIYRTDQSTFGDVIGIQLEGTSQIRTQPSDVERAYHHYYGRKYPQTGASKNHTEDAYANIPEWQFVEVAPSHLYYFNAEIFARSDKRFQ